MPTSTLKVVRALPKPAVLSRQIKKRIKVNLTPLAKRHAFFRQALVAGWQPQHMPRFRGRVTIGRNETVAVDIVIINDTQKIGEFSPATVADLWKWWSETGTKKHLIRPVRADNLRFVIDNQVIFTKLVRHPGTRPNRKAKATLRKLNTRLSGSLNPLLEKSVEEGMWQK